ncbi:MAG: hypothetical protein ACOYD4_11715 [Solirubrobacterales bacterium]
MLEPPFLPVVVAQFAAQGDAVDFRRHLFVGVDEEHGEHLHHAAHAEKLAMVADLCAVVGGGSSRASEFVGCIGEHLDKHLAGCAVE